MFRTEDGTQVFDEFGQEVTRDELDPILISDEHPVWEDFQPQFARKNILTEQRNALLDYQQQLDEAREALVEGEITEAELEELQAMLIADMPKSVRARLPEGHPAAQVETVLDPAATPGVHATPGPSLDGLEGFLPPKPAG